MTLSIAVYLDANPVERWVPLYGDAFDVVPYEYDPELCDEVPERFRGAVAEIVVPEHDIECAGRSGPGGGCLLGALLDGDDDSQVRWWSALVVVDMAGRITYRCEEHAFDAESGGRCVSCTAHHHQGCDGETLDAWPCRCACRPFDPKTQEL